VNRWGLVAILFMGLLVSCSPARFVDPTVKPTNEPDPVYTPQPVPEPEVRERVTEKFVFKKASGEIILGIVVQLQKEHSPRTITRLKNLARTLTFADLLPGESVLSHVDKIRFGIFLEKESHLARASSRWETFSPKTQKMSALRTLVEGQVDSLESALQDTSSESYPNIPFISLETVANSIFGDTTNGPSTLHLAYLRDRDLFTSDSEQMAGARAFEATLNRSPWGKRFSSFSFFGFNAGASKECEPRPSDIAEDITATFKRAGAVTGELCELPLPSIQSALKAMNAPQGRLILSRRATPGTLSVSVSGRILSAHSFSYDGQEVSLAPFERVQTGEPIEVSYEPTN
jgi:hypothetical protein